MSKIYVGDTGTEISLDCGVDVTSAVQLSIEARKPDGTEVSWPADPVDTTFLSYITTGETLDTSGRWRLQAKVTLPSGGPWRGDTVEMTVNAHFT